MKNGKRLKAWQFLLLILASAVLLVLLTFLALDLAGYRYATYNTDNHGRIRYIGRVDKEEDPLSGKIYYADGINAKVSFYGNNYQMDSGWEISSAKTYLVEYSNGDVYIGELEGMLRHGKGSITFAGGDKYEGDFVYDRINGKGSYYYLSGDKYEGEFSAGQKWGQGKYTWAPDSSGRSDVYEGTYEADLRSGTGRYTWADGGVYEGSYVKDAKQGIGKMTFAGGDVYEGQYADDMRTGKGKYVWADGGTYEGEFVKNEITGYGTYSWTSGSNRLSYEGYFEKGKIVFVDSEESGNE